MLHTIQAGKRFKIINLFVKKIINFLYSSEYGSLSWRFPYQLS